MFEMFLTYKQKIVKNKEKSIKKDVKDMKRECIKEFNRSIEKGLNVAFVDFLCHVTTKEFEEEISEIVLKELKQEHYNIDFSFSHRHCQNSYLGIKMVAI